MNDRSRRPRALRTAGQVAQSDLTEEDILGVSASDQDQAQSDTDEASTGPHVPAQAPTEPVVAPPAPVQHAAVLIPGRIVHYLLRNFQCRPALVINPHADGETIDAQVFSNGPRDSGYFFDNNPWIGDIAHGLPRDGKTGTWHWPGSECAPELEVVQAAVGGRT